LLKKPLDKLAKLARAHRAEHEEGRPVVEAALSPNEREPCVQCRIVCRDKISVGLIECEGRPTEQLPTSEEYGGKLYTSLTRRLFAQCDLGGHLSIFPAFLCLAIRMWRIKWGTGHVVGG
jgi:hypothetical protein